MAYTTTDLIAAIKRKASIPTNQSLFSTSDFLEFAWEEMLTDLIPCIMSAREEYFVADYDYSITADQAAYAIPPRAIGDALRDVKVVDGTEQWSLPRLEPEQVGDTASGQEGFFLRANDVVLVPTPTISQYTLRLSHHRRPGKPVATTSAAQITSVGATSVVVSSVPSTWTTGTLVDFIKAKPGFQCLGIDQAITGVSGTTVNFTAVPSGVAVGDWLALATESPIIQIPVELHPVLAQMVANRCQIAQGKPAKVDREELMKMRDAALGLLTPRVAGEPRKIKAPQSLLNTIRRGR